MTTELLLLAILGLLLLLALWSRGNRRVLGLDVGDVVAADDSRLRSVTLRSERLGLVGRPDHLLRVGSDLVPVEQKPSARTLHQSHRIQVGVLCLLVQETYGRRPPYGLVVLVAGRQERVTFDDRLERQVLAVAAEMRRALKTGAIPSRLKNSARCTSCGYAEQCEDDSASPCRG